MRFLRLTAVLLCALVVAAVAEDRVQLKIDGSEAAAVISILDQRAGHRPVTDADWQKLFTSEPYVRLKQREASMHRAFTDADFRRFVLSDDLMRMAPRLKRTLEEWKATNLQAVADRILPYLPADAVVKASVYPVIKPLTNSFVFAVDTNPAIFLYVNPDQSQSAFENTVAHESHHIGFAEASRKYEERIQSLPRNARKAAEWMGAFGEGLAVLAAAGSADVPPLRDFPADQQARWQEDMKYVDQQLRDLNQFFLDVVNGGYAKPEVIDHVGFTFMGYRGPWYTVGYQMGQMVEKHFGRAVLMNCMLDPRQLLWKYNEAAAADHASGKPKQPLWSPEVLKAVGVEAPGP